MLLEVAFKGFCGSFEVHGGQKVTNQHNPEALQRLQMDSVWTTGLHSGKSQL